VGFDQQKLQAALETRRQSQYLPFSFHIFDTVTSTNQTLWELLEQQAKPGTVVIATQQTKGRGQWGRQWISSDGGLYLSVAVDCQIKPANVYQLTLATAWGIAKELRKFSIPVEIKWPNDLVLNGYKLGGILTETKLQQKIKAVIGVGINWANLVPETGITLVNWQNSQNLHPILCLEALASVVLLGIESGLECLFTEGVTTLLSSYVSLLTNIGEKVYVNSKSGTIVGVTSQGELRVCTDENSTVIKNESEIKITEIRLQPGTISLGYSRSERLTSPMGNEISGF
jgi:BirA family biotin operon repressor/biotin-[acetyl-CoA-carboxylase] ligase